MRDESLRQLVEVLAMVDLADRPHRSATLGHMLPTSAIEQLAAAARDAVAGPRPRIVTLCGSTRHKGAFDEANRRLTLAGMLVISVGVFGHADGIELTVEEKTALDELHKRKIDLADEVFIVNPDGRIGDSTRSEIAYATSLGKPVTYLTSPATEASIP